jgi:hypothetical protein
LAFKKGILSEIQIWNMAQKIAKEKTRARRKIDRSPRWVTTTLISIDFARNKVSKTLLFLK